MECPRCHHRIVPGVLFCPECEVPLKVMWEEINPMGSAVWEYEDEGGQGTEDQLKNSGLDAATKEEEPKLPVSRDLRPRP